MKPPMRNQRRRHSKRRQRSYRRTCARRLRFEPLEDRYLLAADFGDAPLPYPTMLAENGALPEASGLTEGASELLQFTAGGHVLGFASDSVYVATGSHALHVEFVGAQDVSPHADGSGEAQQGKAAALSHVSYVGLWEGITLSYDAAAGGIAESTYVLDPGADPGQIRLQYNVPVEIDEAGELVMSFETGQMKESAPVAWQDVDGRRLAVDVSYCRTGDQQVSFALGEYNPAYTLTIDPTLTWTTFLGGSGDEWGLAIAVDDSGNVYVGGRSNATWGSPVRAYSPGGPWGLDAFAAKLASDGSLTWNTFLGGSGHDIGHAIAVDDTGNVYVAGDSNATWGSPVRAHSEVRNGEDAFTAKLASDGALLWNTFLGSGSHGGTGRAIAVDGSGNVYVAGSSTSTWGEPVRDFSGHGDAFAAKLADDGSLIWNTFLGGEHPGGTTGHAIAVDGSGNVYVGGRSSATWGSPVRAYSGNGHPGDGDAFAAKVASNGSLTWNTFLGGSSAKGWDYGLAIAVDGSGNVYVTGWSPATWGSPVRAHSEGADGFDAFAAKLASDGSLTWNTFLGGDSNDYGFAIAVDGSGNVYVGGYSAATWGEPVRAYSGDGDACAAKLASDGSLTWNTFLGGDWSDRANAIAVDGSGNVYVAGDSSGTWDSYTPSSDAFAAKLTNEEGITVDPTSGIATTESGDGATFTVVLDAQPFSDVVISVTSGDTDEATVDQSSLTFTPDTWNDAQTVTITGVDDFILDGDQTTSITLSVDDANSDDAFDPLADQTVSVTTIDDGYHGWQNRRNRFDVNDRDGVTPEDVLTLIVYLNAGNTSLPAPPATPPPFYDVNDDGVCTPLDVLLVIVFINNRQLAEFSEGEAAQFPAPTFAIEMPSSPNLTDRLTSAPLVANGQTSVNNDRSASLWDTARTADDDMSGDEDRTQQAFGNAVWGEAALEELDAAFAELDAVLPDLAAGLS